MMTQRWAKFATNFAIQFLGYILLINTQSFQFIKADSAGKMGETTFMIVHSGGKVHDGNPFTVKISEIIEFNIYQKLNNLFHRMETSSECRVNEIINDRFVVDWAKCFGNDGFKFKAAKYGVEINFKYDVIDANSQHLKRNGFNSLILSSKDSPLALMGAIFKGGHLVEIDIQYWPPILDIRAIPPCIATWRAQYSKHVTHFQIIAKKNSDIILKLLDYVKIHKYWPEKEEEKRLSRKTICDAQIEKPRIGLFSVDWTQCHPPLTPNDLPNLAFRIASDYQEYEVIISAEEQQFENPKLLLELFIGENRVKIDVSKRPAELTIAKNIGKTDEVEETLIMPGHIAIEDDDQRQNKFNEETKSIQREMAEKYKNMNNIQQAADGLRKLIEKSKKIYQIYPMNAESTKAEYQKYYRKLFLIVHPDKGGNLALAQKVTDWKLEIDNHFEKMKEEAIIRTITLTIADKISTKIKEFIVAMENNQSDEFLKNPYNLEEQIILELEKEEKFVGAYVRHDLKKFQEILFERLDNEELFPLLENYELPLSFDKEKEFEKLKKKLAEASIILIGRCYARKFLTFDKISSSYSDSVLDYHKYYGNGAVLFHNFREKNDDGKIKIGEFYAKYITLFNDKLAKIAEEMAQMSDQYLGANENYQKEYWYGVDKRNYMPKYFAELLNYEELICSGSKDLEKENPREWAVFGGTSKKATEKAAFGLHIKN